MGDRYWNPSENGVPLLATLWRNRDPMLADKRCPGVHRRGQGGTLFAFPNARRADSGAPVRVKLDPAEMPSRKQVLDVPRVEHRL